MAQLYKFWYKHIDTDIMVYIFAGTQNEAQQKLVIKYPLTHADYYLVMKQE